MTKASPGVRLLQAVHATEARAATGFDSTTPRVWNLSTQQAVFAAAAPKGNRKLPPHDPHTTSLAFLVSFWVPCDRSWRGAAHLCTDFSQSSERVAAGGLTRDCGCA